MRDHMTERSYRRLGLFICFAALLGAPFFFYGSWKAFESNVNDPADWLPKEFEQTEVQKWFVARFDTDLILVANWPGCTTDDERLDRFKEGLLAAEVVEEGGESGKLFRHVFTGRETLQTLTSPPIELSRKEALKRMQGWQIGPDGETTCAVAVVTLTGYANRHFAVESVYRVGEEIGIPRDKLRMGGPTVDGVAIDKASNKWLLHLGCLSAACGIGIAWWCLRSLRHVAAVFCTAAFAWSVSLTEVYLTGENLDAVLVVMPGLVYVLTVSGAVHLTGYYCDAIREHGPTGGPLRALELGWLPCFLAAGTTALGLGSLMVSELVPIKKFGFFSAVGVMVGLVSLFLLWPALMQQWASRKTPAAPGGSTPGDGKDSRKAWWESWYQFSVRRRRLILVTLMLAFPLLGYGVFRIRTSINLQDVFWSKSKIIQDYEALESSIGPLLPVEVVLELPAFDRDDPQYRWEMLARLELVERLRRDIVDMPDVGGAIAVTTFIPKVSTTGGTMRSGRRGVVARKLVESRDQFVDLQYLYDDREDNKELWRITARVKALGEVDQASYLTDLKGRVEKFLANDEQAVQLGAETEVCGGVFLVAMAQEQLLKDLRNSFLVAFLLIAVTMMILLRRFTAGLLTMIPNVFPALLIFGVMGLLGIRVDIGAMMTASVAMGIAVDDTSHFLTWFRRGMIQGMSREQAIHFSYRQCATAMLETSLICGLGMLAFSLSSFVPVARFAWLMCTLLFAALAGDLIVLPAMLASPLGARFVPRKKHDAAEQTPVTA